MLTPQGSKRRRFRQLVLERDQIVNNVRRVQVSSAVFFSDPFLMFSQPSAEFPFGVPDHS